MPPPATDAEWLALVRESQRSLWPAIARIGGGEVLELDGGVLAMVVPSTPDRSVFNSVLYRDGEALVASLDRIACAYERAGVRAWTVWVPEAERETAAALERAGHVLDAEPRAMAARIGDLDLSAPLAAAERLGLASERGPYALAEAGAPELARLNELAYELEPGQFAPVAAGMSEGAHLHFAAHDGAPVAAVVGWDHDGVCEICWVATAPAHRGRGLAAALMAQALRAAEQRGCVLTTLEATRAGRPVYEALGYRDFGALQMWERRVSA